MGSTMDHGDEIIIPEPFYANYNGFLHPGYGCSVISSIDTGFALPAIADFEKLITPKTKAILFVIQEIQRVICIQKRRLCKLLN
jgi:aspartate aminotransferase